MTLYEERSVRRFEYCCGTGMFGSESLIEFLKIISMYGNLKSLNKYCKKEKLNYNTLKKHSVELDGHKFYLNND